ncbi:MAG: protein TolR [Magnetospirillum gryphiswaldense]|uniref:protein TolR n=1 Tax=Magnetospirillum sp. 64-120 TaxID=1895778 RepID=UPI0009296274|nr:protein TolR [Magnetospirillum sp. 64-120]MBI2240738.1 protein TolR [Magnetospirillum gryphiswaldense]OJX81247.1 MAG: protein TolR [Magnetospirillum sp. 64-120]
MGAAVGPRKGGRNRHRPVSDINVTPMVDVMLVLLIIFMVTAPLLTAGVQVDLPKTSAAPIKGDDQPLSVSIDAKGDIWIQETMVTLEELAPKLQAITAQKPDTRIFIRGDKGIDYGRVMEVMGNLGSAGFTKVSLVTEMKSEAPASSKKGGR